LVRLLVRVARAVSSRVARAASLEDGATIAIDPSPRGFESGRLVARRVSGRLASTRDGRENDRSFDARAVSNSREVWMETRGMDRPSRASRAKGDVVDSTTNESAD
jgi:hypothetical protein